MLPSLADDEPADAKRGKVVGEIAPLRAVPAAEATTGACCARLANDVLMPWVGFGTYKLPKAKQAVAAALRCGYRLVDSAFIYGGEKTEPEVGTALQAALRTGDALTATTAHRFCSTFVKGFEEIGVAGGAAAEGMEFVGGDAGYSSAVERLRRVSMS